MSDLAAEERLGEVRVTGLRDVPFGRFPEGRVVTGKVVRSARARLLRQGVVEVEDLRVGALIRERVIGTSLEARESMGLMRECTVALGHGDVREDDRIEIYLRGAPPSDLVHQSASEGPERVIGKARVRVVNDDPLAGPVGQGVSEGMLPVGARARISRDGRVVAEALRMLAVADGAGRLVDELPPDGAGSFYLGHFDLRPGDIVTAYDVPPRAWREVRGKTLRAVEVHLHGELAIATVMLDVSSLAVGHRARVIRKNIVIADGLTIEYLPEIRLRDRLSKLSSSTQATENYLGLAFPCLRTGDYIQAYRLLPPALRHRQPGLGASRGG